ncbi:hypothetical protein ACIPRL_35600, partial [Streptomyces sp. NPDC090085]
MDDSEEFDELMRKSSLGSSGALQAIERVPAGQADAVQQIIQLRNKIAHGSDRDRAHAAHELASLLRSLGFTSHGEIPDEVAYWALREASVYTKMNQVLMELIQDLKERLQHPSAVSRRAADAPEPPAGQTPQREPSPNSDGELLPEKLMTITHRPDSRYTRFLSLPSRKAETDEVIAKLRDLGKFVLDAQVRTLGPDHPDTLTTRSNQANRRGQAGDAAGAAAAYAELLADQIRVLGPDHPGTLTTRSNQANWRGQAGDAAGAAAAYAE